VHFISRQLFIRNPEKNGLFAEILPDVKIK